VSVDYIRELFKQIEMNERYIRRRYFNKKATGSFSGFNNFFNNNTYKDKTEVKKTIESLYTYNVHRDAKRKFKFFAILFNF